MCEVCEPNFHKSPLEPRWLVGKAEITATLWYWSVYIGIRSGVLRAVVTVPERNKRLGREGVGLLHYANYQENYGHPNIFRYGVV